MGSTGDGGGPGRRLPDLRAAGAVVAVLATLGNVAAAGEPARYALQVTLDPGARSLRVAAEVTLPSRLGAEAGATFLLHPGLDPRSATPGVTVRRLNPAPGPEAFGSGVAPRDLPGAVAPWAYRVELPKGVRSFALTYGGELHHPLSEGADYARGFRHTPGIIGPEGVYLAGTSVWIPWFGPDLVAFRVEVSLPPGWDAVSQGGRTLLARDGTGARVRWDCPHPQDEVYLVAGPWTEARRSAEGVELLAFLRRPDPGLAAKYLEAGAQYLATYAELLGPYPYPVFSLVENFWETGWGMPGFTLLGPRVIRFPFILHSSYPHEILHNWWGNGVYVDYPAGNWSEGLTAYLADHWIQEGRGNGREHRHSALQKYADYAARERDFPLVEFRSRHSAASEAVGYGKAMLLYHMLRLRLGDAVFVEGLRALYRDFRFRAASFADVRRAFESAAGRDLAADFDPWITRDGAPVLAVGGAEVRPEGAEWVLSLRLVQQQPEAPYRLRVPYAVTLEGHAEAREGVVEVEGRARDLEVRLPARPLRVDVDPDFDLFRRLDPRESPPALSGAFGAEKVLAVLPAAAPPALGAAYRAVAEVWARGQPGQWQVVTDREVKGFPADRAVVLFGWENQLLPGFGAALAPQGVGIGPEGVAWAGGRVPRAGGSAVLSARHPADPGLTLAWVAAAAPEALPGLGRKLPHYHKYSYLGFEGDEPTNVLKGRWPVLDSPLGVALALGAQPAARAGRAPLRPLPGAYSAERLGATVARLADPALEGRGFGTPGAAEAGRWLAEAFAAAGLMPGGDDGGWFQTTRGRAGEPAREEEVRNVVGLVPGRRYGVGPEAVVVGAHYDGLGRGEVGGRTQDRGQIHPGADDNASGVAVLLELARAMAGQRPERTVVFAAFGGEEVGRLGSRHFVDAHAAGRPLAMVNLDTVGRLGSGKVLALGAGTAREWGALVQAAGLASGVPVAAVGSDVGGSDQVSFVAVGVPALQLFTGPHLDYHRPGDTAERVDAGGLARVTALAAELVGSLAARGEPLTWTGAAPVGSGAGARKVSLGVVPDFAYGGPGVRLSGVAPRSPVAGAGLRAGDVIRGLGEAEVVGLGDLGRLLQDATPGDRVVITYEREGSLRSVEAVLEAK